MRALSAGAGNVRVNSGGIVTKSDSRTIQNGELSTVVKRFTTLSSALDALNNKRIVLLNPKSWDDKNDSYFIDIYKNKKDIKSILALCCTRSTETYHHWKVFTPESEGVCIEFYRSPLERVLTGAGAKVGVVKYMLLKDLEALDSSKLEDLPFIKRNGFKDEREWRVICAMDRPDVMSCPIDINLEMVNRVVLNPWMPESLVNNIRAMIKSIPGCGDLRIERSRLINSAQWKKAGEKICA